MNLRRVLGRALASPSSSSEAIAFDEAKVRSAPNSPGVYFLSRAHRVIFVGVAVHGTTIRRELLQHLRGERGACTQTASEFEYDCSPNPRALYWFYLEKYGMRTGGLLPECNERDPRTFGPQLEKRSIPLALRVQKYLGGQRYPARKSELLARARECGADEQVKRALLEVPDRVYESPVALSCEIGRQAQLSALRQTA